MRCKELETDSPGDTMHRRTYSLLLFAAVLLLGGCRGTESPNTPIHPNTNMDFQERFDPQEPNPMFEDNRAMRPPVPGTVARGLLREDTYFHLGRTETGEYVEDLPVPLTRVLLQRGQERYNIYCAVCHGATGDGLGVIMVGLAGQGYGYTPAPSYHEERLREVSNGYLYEVITNGVRNMPSYAQQIPVLDRWAIVAYVRALQRARFAPPEDVPAEILPELQEVARAQAAAAEAEAAEAEEADTEGAAEEGGEELLEEAPAAAPDAE